MDNSSSIRTAIAAVCIICLLATTPGASLAAYAANGAVHTTTATTTGAPAPFEPARRSDEPARAGAGEVEEDKKPEDKKASGSPSPVAPDETGATPPAQRGTPSQQTTIIIVDERILTGTQSFPQQRSGGRIFLPVASIARALGDVIEVDAAKRSVEVRRQTGVVARFDAQLNQVSENNALVLSVSNAADITFPPNPDELMLPVEIVSALLDASVRVDEAAHAIRITRGRPQANTVRAGAGRAAFELYQLGYDYNLNSYSAASHQSLTLRADGRIGDGRFNLLTNSSVGGGGGLGLLRNGSFTYERPNEQRFTGGDFGTGTDLLFISSTMRGVSAQLPVRNARLTIFAGRAISGVPTLQTQDSTLSELQTPASIQPHKIRYDTNVFGASATFNLSAGASSSYSPGQTLFSVGMIRFDGAGRSGQMLTASARTASARGRFQGDVAVGRFSGTRPDGARVEGGALAADLSAAYDLSNRLTIQGRYTQIGANFLSAQAGMYEPVRAASGGATWRPADWLAASFTGSFSTRPADALSGQRQRERFLTATFNLTPRRNWPSIFFSHTESSTTKAGGSYTLVNAAKDFSGWRLFLNATRIKSFGAAFLNAQVGANVRLGEAGALGLSQSFGSRGALGGAVDWNGQSFLKERVSFGAGFNYNRIANSPVTTTGRVFTNIQLPRRSTLGFTYSHGQSGTQILFSLRGSLFSTRRADAAFNAPVAELNSYGAFYGRVYQDINLNGHFDAGLDKPQANVKIRVDGSRYVISDESGRYRIDNVHTGEHEITLDLLSVRADLTLLDGAQQAASLSQGRDSIVDFRLVRTGRITGLVWLDTNGNHRPDDGEQPLAGVRVLTGSNRDTLTDENGVYVIGDLPPGEHAVLIDEKTLPEKTVSASGTRAAKVLAGSESGNINFPITPAPPEIKRFASNGN
ncbi:MAG TPA: stalk domain-containing protein [Pyrinomonadaceae bacterium]